MNIFSIFDKDYERILKPENSFDAMIPPLQSIKELQKKSSNRKQCLKIMKKKTQNGFKIMRRQSLVHMLLIHTNTMYDFATSFTDQFLKSSNEWLNENVILPYYLFLRKIVVSQELYISIKTGKVQFDFEKMFYLHQLFTELFKVVKKMPLIGRYYKDKNNPLTSTFIQVIAVQAQRFYSYYKNSLQQVLTSPKVYLKCREEEKLLKAILEDSLPFINEEMKKLFLDKYFYPYGKGICIKLFRTQEQTQNCCRIINGIVNDHRDTERRYEQQSLQKTLFPQDGKIDYEFYEQSLMPELSKRYEFQIQEMQQQIEEMDFEESQIDAVKETLKQTSDQLEKCEQV